MQLNDFKPAWKQLKLLNTMQHIESNVVLSIIESRDNTYRIKLQRILMGIVMFVVIAISCQGG